MRTARRLVGLTMAGLVLSFVTGCEDTRNEEGTGKLTSLPATGKDGGPPPTSQEDYFKSQQKAAGSNPYGQGYPGSR